jgi:hypothetical protein
MTRVPITKLRIKVYVPTEVGDPYLAFIGPLPIVFKDSSPIKVRKRAEAWRQEEFEKLPKSRREQLLASAESGK